MSANPKISRDELLGLVHNTFVSLALDLKTFERELTDICEAGVIPQLNTADAQVVWPLLYACSLYEPNIKSRRADRDTIGPWELLKAIEIAVGRLSLPDNNHAEEKPS